MESVAEWFANTLGQYLSAEMTIFIVSMLPILECRAGLIVASLLKVNIWRAIPICVFGNILPIPFILMFVKKLFAWLKQFSFFRGFVEKLEKRAEHKSKELDEGEFVGLLLFVGIPLPGTGGWTGSLIASILEMDIKKATLAIFLGILMATVIIATLSYGLLKFI
ncbi:MAG: small multi-drug export protein [Erysipelotrichaceae bacterium]|nr:small multi-drug export protein [Erysipelotrichaceae bacterium]